MKHTDTQQSKTKKKCIIKAAESAFLRGVGVWYVKGFEWTSCWMFVTEREKLKAGIGWEAATAAAKE